MKKLLLAILALVTVVAAAGAVFVFYILPSRVARDLSTFLTDRTGRDVEIAALDWSFAPALHLEGTGIVVGADRPGVPALVELGAFTMDASVGDLTASPRRIRAIRLDELRVQFSRGRTDDEGDQGDPTAPVHRNQDSSSPETPVVIDRLEAAEVRLEIGSSDLAKDPRVFDIHTLTLDSVALDRPIGFEATLTNPKPVGEVATRGQFGPWNKSDVADTPISGRYAFTDADLGEFNGISGILHSTGVFGGSFGQIEARGEATIPDFTVTGGEIVPLDVAFEVAVGDDASDVQLRSVVTRFFDSVLDATGEVTRVEGVDGRRVVVDVTAADARIEDLVRFALQSDVPPLTGQIDLRTRLEIPPGDDRPVIEKMLLDGEFTIEQARFSSLDVQKTLTQISQIGQGVSPGEAGPSVVSDLAGVFEMAEASLGFSRVSFSVPGMAVRLVGSYGLADGALDFGGEIHLDQPASQLVPTNRLPDRVAPWIRLLDPLFQRDEVTTGTVVPITISGTRSSPRFRVEVAQLKPDWRRLLDQFTSR
ncbi:MAG: hypothetical protein O3A25_03770 [Acidobacteria bacterium]|nr:hypothetical protein [Acidobacteriota bacterium]